MRIAVIGGGVLGSMHAWQALQRGHHVLHLEREADARGASVRNFGLIWVSGRAAGPELRAAQRGRELWAGLAREVPELGLRACGSLTVLRTDAELAVATELVASGEATRRGTELLDAEATRRINPALRGTLLGALHCRSDAAVEPRTAQRAIRCLLQRSDGYTWLPDTEARELGEHGASVRDDHGRWHHADRVLLCTGARTGGLVRELVGELPVRRVRLHMLQTAPLGGPLPTAVADADSMRYYPAYRGAQLRRLQSEQPQSPLGTERGMQLLMTQRADGGLTIGDSHDYEEPFEFDTEDRLHEHIAGIAGELLGGPIPAVRRRWAGVYCQGTEPGEVCLRRRIGQYGYLVTGPGGRGMTAAPAIAEESMAHAGL